MKRNGFIATSILYSFFLIFITLFVALIMNYLHNQVLVKRIDSDAWNFLQEVNNLKVSDLELGDYVKFNNKAGANMLNGDAVWVVSYIETSGTNKHVYFMSDLTAQEVDVYIKLSTEKFAKVHPVTVDVYNEIRNQNLYTTSIKFPGVNFQIPTASMLAKIRNQAIDTNILSAIFGTAGDYLVYIDTATGGYTVGSYYDMRTYTFSLGSAQSSLVPTYCGGTYNGSVATYNSNNPFGYINVVKETLTNGNYVNYCSFASPVAYTHNASDLVVDSNEAAASDRILTTYSSLYTIRLMADVNVNVNATNTYVSGGKGTKTDPYILDNGVKTQ